jgi:hypothetical protein
VIARFRLSGRLRRGLALAAALALPLALPMLSPAQAADPAPPFQLWTPASLTVNAYDGQLWSDLGIRAIALNEPFELWSNRPSYDDLIHTEWRSTAGTVALPEGSMPDFGKLANFLYLKFERADGVVRKMPAGVCFGGWSTQRVRPDAPARSPYPQGCWANPYSLGSVQGVQTGWSTALLAQDKPMKLKPGEYTVTVRIAKAYADLFHIPNAGRVRMMHLSVTQEDNCCKPGPVGRTSGRAVAQPATSEPTAPSAGTLVGPTPDLRTLPAFGIGVARNGNYLQFAATVWNGGDSPLVVDGFRREGEDLMDAYQYFFDTDGNQTGYQQVGQMHWDPRPTHQHWHFEDFARYSLLDASKVEKVRSKKEAFCLANTDAVDTTVPGAAWNPQNTDLATACGDLSSLSVREVLSAGWGDTYAQFRAGQSFDLKGLPNGRYYIAVVANPGHNLVESDYDNNVSLRKIWIGGTPDHRTVNVPQVGVIVEPNWFGEGA